MKKALVCGAGGFIGHHLVRYLKNKGYFVRGVDLKYPEFSSTSADEFLLLDLREYENCKKALILSSGKFDEVYQLAADMGGMGFISWAECEVLTNNVFININMTKAACEAGVEKYFFSSSVCVYRDMEPGEPKLYEKDAYPAMPDNEYGWEKLYSERVLLAYSRRYGIKARIARFENCFGPEGTWRGGREKAPAAICRKVAEAKLKGLDEIEVWGDGSAIRNYIYIDDLVEAVYILMQSDVNEPVNIGTEEYISVKELVDIVSEIAEKKVKIKWVPGPVGVKSRNFSHEKIYSLGWKPKYTIKEGLKITYKWIETQLKKAPDF
uniref:NAD-dependent epimerase/dehydratase family protein n=1 Tax=candidate division WOR-3 bacterium TaxID=2052148 RepID=A0A7V3ZTS2_UNCW3